MKRSALARRRTPASSVSDRASAARFANVDAAQRSVFNKGQKLPKSLECRNRCFSTFFYAIAGNSWWLRRTCVMRAASRSNASAEKLRI